MSELVRVRTESGIETNVSRVHAEKTGLTILDEAVEDTFGRPKRPSRPGGRRVKPRTTVVKQVAARKATSQAPVKKAAAKKVAAKKAAASKVAAPKAVTEPATATKETDQ